MSISQQKYQPPASEAACRPKTWPRQASATTKTFGVKIQNQNVWQLQKQFGFGIKFVTKLIQKPICLMFLMFLMFSKFCSKKKFLKKKCFQERFLAIRAFAPR